MAQRIITLILLLCSASASAGLFDAPGRSNFVPADRAFAFDFQQNQHDLNLSWHIKDGYYLYRKQITLTTKDAAIVDPSLPPGEWHEDEFYGKSEIYRQRLMLPITLTQAGKAATLTVTYQGCADAGFCYPPETKVVPLSAVLADSDKAQAAKPSAPATLPASGSQTGAEPASLPFSALWALLIGIGIAFTPCVLPMYPLISGIVLGGKQRLSTARALLLAFIYVQDGGNLYRAGSGRGRRRSAIPCRAAAPLRINWAVSGIYRAGAVDVRPVYATAAFIAANPTDANEQQAPWGSPGGVFAMGAIAGLICSPCTTAPLSAILLYIAQSGNLWLGGGTLYLYALGMGLPLIPVTVFGNRLLPKSGPWMAHVKTAFGFVILALPVFTGARYWRSLGFTPVVAAWRRLL